MKPLSHFLLQTADGLSLPALLYGGSSKNNADRAKGLLIFVHGAGSSSIIRHPVLNQALSDELATVDTDVLLFNNRGAGYITKFDTISGKSYLGGMAYEKIADSVRDIDAALAWAYSEGYKNVYLAGHSTGANKLVYWAATRTTVPSQVKALLLIGGGDDISLQQSRYSKDILPIVQKCTHKAAQSELLQKSLVPHSMFPGSHPISWQSLHELITPGSDYDIFPFGRPQGSKSFARFSHIRIPQVLVVYGSEDFGTIIKPEAAVKMLQGVLPVHGTVIAGADHSFTGMERELALALRTFIETL